MVGSSRPWNWGARRWLDAAEPGAGGAEDGDFEIDSVNTMGFIQNQHTEKNLLRPFAVLVTVRSGRTSAALAPPHASGTAAGITLLVMRPKRPESAKGHWLQYLLTPAHDQDELANRVTVNTTSYSLSATSRS